MEHSIATCIKLVAKGEEGGEGSASYITISINSAHPWNVYSPMAVTPSGRTSLIRVMSNLNALLPSSPCSSTLPAASSSASVGEKVDAVDMVVGWG
jgi:hypothetical protein